MVFNIKSQETRLCYVTPSDSWGDSQDGLLGVTIRVDSYANAEENLLRVLYVEDNSPAQVAGLKAESDYMLGTKSATLASSDILFQVLQHNKDNVVEIYVYNTESDIVRIVNIMPTYSWGGHGLLGAEVGSGYLHRIPKKCRSTNGRTLQKDGTIQNSKGVPIDLSDPNTQNISHSQNEPQNDKSEIMNNVDDNSKSEQKRINTTAIFPIVDASNEEDAMNNETKEKVLNNIEPNEIPSSSSPSVEHDDPRQYELVDPISSPSTIKQDGSNPNESESTFSNSQLIKQNHQSQDELLVQSVEASPEKAIPDSERSKTISSPNDKAPPSHNELVNDEIVPQSTSNEPKSNISSILPPPPISGSNMKSSTSPESPHEKVPSSSLFSSFFPPPPFFSKQVETGTK